jgi:twitching motility protein PilI
MAQKTDLHEFQQRLKARLEAVETTPLASKLGFQAGEHNWLVDLAYLSEVASVREVAHVPLARHWFLGIANIRGDLYCVSDLCGFIAGRNEEPNPQNQMLLIKPGLIRNSALAVGRIIGLRTLEQLSARAPRLPNWVAAAYDDAEGNTWHELDLPALVAAPEFLQVAK